jgi:hypothetical protein
MKDYKALVKKSFEAVVEDLNYNESVIREYFSDSYLQQVDGKVLDFEAFCRHMQVQKQAVNAISIAFKTLAQEDDIVFSNHLVTIETKERRKAVVKVIAEFRLKDGKIVYCDELTRQVSGHGQDSDLGSRY